MLAGWDPPGSAGGVKVRIAGTNCYLPSVFNLYLHCFLLFHRARICRPLHSSPSAGTFGQTLVLCATACVQCCYARCSDCSPCVHYTMRCTRPCKGAWGFVHSPAALQVGGSSRPSRCIAGSTVLSELMSCSSIFINPIEPYLR